MNFKLNDRSAIRAISRSDSTPVILTLVCILYTAELMSWIRFNERISCKQYKTIFVYLQIPYSELK